MDDYLALMASVMILAPAWRILTAASRNIRVVLMRRRGEPAQYVSHLDFEVATTFRTAPVIVVARNSLCEPMADRQAWFDRMHQEGRVQHVQE